MTYKSDIDAMRVQIEVYEDGLTKQFQSLGKRLNEYPSVRTAREICDRLEVILACRERMLDAIDEMVSSMEEQEYKYYESDISL